MVFRIIGITYIALFASSAIAASSLELDFDELISNSKEMVVGSFTEKKYQGNSSGKGKTHVMYRINDASITKNGKTKYNKKYTFKVDNGIDFLGNDEILGDTDEVDAALVESDTEFLVTHLGGFPEFEKDTKYIVFFEKGKDLVFPSTGGAQGVFIVDDANGVFTYDGLPVLGIRRGELILPEVESDLSTVAEPLLTFSEGGEDSITYYSGADQSISTSIPMNIDEFIDYVERNQ